MKLQPLALIAAGLIATISTAANADSFEPRVVSAGVEYRISLGGSTRTKPPAPTLGFNINVIRAQNGPAFDFVIPTLSLSENKFNKLIDVRFDADTKVLHSMHVNGVNVLKDATRLNMDPNTLKFKEKEPAPEVDWLIVGSVVVGAIVINGTVVQDDSNKNKKTPAPACVPTTFADVSYVMNAICP
jgi:hypothetical protein